MSRKPKTKLKLKSKRAAVKRFRRTGKGHFKRNKAFTRHILTKKAPGRKRGLATATLVSAADEEQVRRMLLS